MNKIHFMLFEKKHNENKEEMLFKSEPSGWITNIMAPGKFEVADTKSMRKWEFSIEDGKKALNFASKIGLYLKNEDLKEFDQLIGDNDDLKNN